MTLTVESIGTGLQLPADKILIFNDLVKNGADPVFAYYLLQNDKTPGLALEAAMNDVKNESAPFSTPFR